MRNLAVIDDHFDAQITSAHQLFIRFGSHGLALAVYDTGSRIFKALKNIWLNQAITPENEADSLRSLLHAEQYLIQRFPSVKFLYLSPRSVLIPTSVFRKEQPELYLTCSYPADASERVLYRKLPSLDAFAVYPIRQDVYNQIGLMLPDAGIYHQSAPMIANALSYAGKRPENDQVHLSIYPGFVDLLVVKQGKLMLYNSYLVTTPEEIGYFTLLLFDQFSLSREETPLLVSGYPELFTGTIDVLSKYIGSVSACTNPDAYGISRAFDAINLAEYDTLLNLALCE